MNYFGYTLVGDGASDRALLPIIDWVLREHTDRPFSSSFFSSSEARTHELDLKVSRATHLYPCEILFVHRDAEHADNYQRRIDEILAVRPPQQRAYVPIVPIRMTEAWLLFSERALRVAASNPNGDVALQLAAPPQAERLVDPKERLFELLRIASGRPSRRLKSFSEGQARARVAEIIDDFSPLRVLVPFQEFELATEEAIRMIDESVLVPV